VEARTLRERRIPQLVGMAVAARLLATDLPRELVAAGGELIAPGTLREFAAVDEETATRLSSALGAWLLERARRLTERCQAHAARWLAEAHRAEGRAEALDELAASPVAARATSSPPEG
jgi:hypothetical protein